MNPRKPKYANWLPVPAAAKSVRPAVVWSRTVAAAGLESPRGRPRGAAVMLQLAEPVDQRAEVADQGVLTVRAARSRRMPRPATA